MTFSFNLLKYILGLSLIFAQANASAPDFLPKGEWQVHHYECEADDGTAKFIQRNTALADGLEEIKFSFSGYNRISQNRFFKSAKKEMLCQISTTYSHVLDKDGGLAYSIVDTKSTDEKKCPVKSWIDPTKRDKVRYEINRYGVLRAYYSPTEWSKTLCPDSAYIAVATPVGVKMPDENEFLPASNAKDGLFYTTEMKCCESKKTCQIELFLRKGAMKEAKVLDKIRIGESSNKCPKTKKTGEDTFFRDEVQKKTFKLSNNRLSIFLFINRCPSGDECIHSHYIYGVKSGKLKRLWSSEPRQPAMFSGIEVKLKPNGDELGDSIEVIKTKTLRWNEDSFSFE